MEVVGNPDMEQMSWPSPLSVSGQVDIVSLSSQWGPHTIFCLILQTVQSSWLRRDISPCQNGWIFGKVPNGLWPPLIFGKSYCNFSEIHDRSIIYYNGKNLQYKFLDWKWPAPFGTFPKIHPFWRRSASLRAIHNVKEGRTGQWTVSVC